MLPIIVAGAVIAGAVALGLRRRHQVRRHAERQGWRYVERDDELASTWTMPPFVDLRSPNDMDLPRQRPQWRVEDVVQLTVANSLAMSFQLTDPTGTSPDTMTTDFHVVALHTGQDLPRSIARGGIDVYALPAYEGLQRVREPKIQLRSGVLAVLSEDPRVLDRVPFTAIRNEMGLDRRLTVVTDGDWIYAYRSGAQETWRIEDTLLMIQRLARAIPGKSWPGPEDLSSNVYGAV